MRVRHWNTSVDGPLSETAMRRKLESAGYLVARYVYPAVGDEPVVCLDAAKM